MSEILKQEDPFDSSLCGEYIRILLAGVATCSGVFWLFHLMMGSVAVVMVIANVIVLTIAIGSHFAGLCRLAILLLLTPIIVVLLVQQDTQIWSSAQVMFSPIFTLLALLVLLIRDGWIVIRSRNRAITPTTVLAVVTGLALATYMIVIPAIDAVLEPFRDRPTSYVMEDLTSWEILRVRSAKLTVFAVFAYGGACVGSFLNVAASSAPRREAIALRSSACPKCGKPIRRIDNLPIISYRRLGGRCRDCQTPIPIRYFMVELSGMAIFASLFLFELITGAANIPGFIHYHYTGIIWMILYTKWPVVGIYFLHGMLFSCLLMLALMEQDDLQAPRWMKMSLLIGFASSVIAIPTMLTVSVGDQTPFQFPGTLPEWLDRTANCIVGGLLGWTLGRLCSTARLRLRQSSKSLPFSFTLLGITLGWQAVLTIGLLWLIATNLLKNVGGRHVRRRWLTPATLLVLIAMLHHPAWKWLSERIAW
ncbi:prepilin peptidase [bacterium]|nr:prepilin peptidase [bacterium]